MASTTRKPKAETAKVSILDRFKVQLVRRVGIVDRFDKAAILSTVILGETLAAMFDAVDEDTPPVKADAPASERKARMDTIRNEVLSYVREATGHFYSWSGVSAWIDAARVNATLPEHLQVTIDEDDENAIPTGVFGTWPLRALGRIEDEAVRATLAETLASEGLTTQAAVESAVKEALGESTEPREPAAAAAMVKALVKRFRKAEAGMVGKVEHVALTVDEDDALLLSDFGRALWSATPSDSAETDSDKRKRKRLEVFRAAAEEILFAGESAEDDGAENGSEPVL